MTTTNDLRPLTDREGRVAPDQGATAVRAVPAAAPPVGGGPFLNGALVASVVAFAFLTGCFVAGNSDFFQHLASGRWLARGPFRPGGDPFAYTAASAHPSSPSWLFDLLLYGVYTLSGVGGEVAVVLKALLVAGLAGLMLATGRKPGQGPLLSCATTALAVVVLSPRLLLQPVCVSFFLLGLTLWLLRQTEASGGRWLRSGWLLVPLFALWVNLDGWFLLGPAAVALYLAGEAVQGGPGSAARVRSLAVVLALGLGACLLNPRHVYAFSLPWQAGLSAAADALAGDHEFRMLFVSPLNDLYLKGSLGRHVAGLAYFPLVLLGLVSFAVNVDRVRWSRLLLWGAFGAVSLANHRVIPFFAVVAGPITALNYLDFIARRFAAPAGAAPARRRGAVLGYAAAVVLGLGLVAVTVPGWLHANPAGRRVGLGVRVDPSLRQAALTIKGWREGGLIAADERLFNTTPDVAAYLAWFSPEEPGFMDFRLPLYPAAVAEEFVAVRAALVGEPKEAAPAGAAEAPPWRAVFTRWNVRYLVAHLRDPRQPASRVVARRLLTSPDGSPDEWTVCFMDGRTMIARWNGVGAGGRTPSAPALAADRLAFGPDAVASPAAAPAAPAGPPGRSAWWDDRPARPLAADEAYLQLYRYQVLRDEWSFRDQQAWQAALAAGIAGAAGNAPANTVLPMLYLDWPYRRLHESPEQAGKGPLRDVDRLAEGLLNDHLSRRESGPTASLYLAARAGRRAAAENPSDADTFSLLGQVYFHLARRRGDLGNEQSFPHLALIRQSQAAGALRQAVRLAPDDERAHGLLAEVAQRGTYLVYAPPADPRAQEPLLLRPNLELELKHRREALRCARLNADPSGGRPASARLEQMDKQLKALEDRVRSLRDQYELSAAGKPAEVRGEMALNAGLVETALAGLLSARAGSDRAKPGGGTRGPARAAELLLSTGRLEEAGEYLRAQGRRALGMLPLPLGLPAHDWFQVQLAAAAGDYEVADRGLAGLLAPPAEGFSTASGRLAAAAGHQLLWEAPLAARLPWQIARKLPFLYGLPPTGPDLFRQVAQQSVGLLQHETDLIAVRGCLALEAGQTASALGQFHLVLERCQYRHGPRSPGGGAGEGRGWQPGSRRGASGPVFLLRSFQLARRYAELLEANEARPGQ